MIEFFYEKRTFDRWRLYHKHNTLKYSYLRAQNREKKLSFGLKKDLSCDKHLFTDAQQLKVAAVSLQLFERLSSLKSNLQGSSMNFSSRFHVLFFFSFSACAFLPKIKFLQDERIRRVEAEKAERGAGDRGFPLPPQGPGVELRGVLPAGAGEALRRER